MKRSALILLTLIPILSAVAQNSITSAEKKKAQDYLNETKSNVLSLVNGLSQEQLNYKISKEEWSISECMEHLALSEKNIIDMIKMSLQEDADQSKRSEVAMNDDQVVNLITSRDQKVKTRKEFEPTNSFNGFSLTVKTFKQRRKENIEFLKSTDSDLRNHYLQFPFGLIDTYQGILFMAGHTQRHADQIREIIASRGFPG